jgi:hypothetical protein
VKAAAIAIALAAALGGCRAFPDLRFLNLLPLLSEAPAEPAAPGDATLKEAS